METPELVKIDPWLKPYKQSLFRRHQMAVLRMLDFTDGKCSLKDKANHHLYYGLHKSEKNTWVTPLLSQNKPFRYFYFFKSKKRRGHK